MAMDAEKYLSGFNLGYLVGVHQFEDDVTKQVREIIKRKPELPYSRGFSKGYCHGRARLKLNKKDLRMNELNQIHKSDSKDMEVER
jgi:hypothetical protein